MTATLTSGSGKFVSTIVVAFAVVFGSGQNARAECGWWETLWCTEETKTRAEARPLRDDLIRAVRGNVGTKVFQDKTSRVVRIRKTCSAVDVATDIYMPRNPELAKCPSVGAAYWVNRREINSIERPCPELPNIDSSWSVSDLGNNRWRLGTGGSVWTLTLLSGQIHTQDRSLIIIKSSSRDASFGFKIESGQPC